MRRTTLTSMPAAVVLACAAAAGASSTPVGPLPAGPSSSIATQRGELVAVALPHRPSGRVWRIARAFDAAVLREVSEADVGANVVVVFRAGRAGAVTVRFALTRGETAKALESRTFHVSVK